MDHIILSSSHGSAAVIIEDLDGHPLIKSYLETRGDRDDFNPYRSELAGVFSGCMVLQLFEAKYSPRAVKVEFGCDNKTAVDSGLLVRSFSRIPFAHFDLIWEIQSFILSTKLNLDSKHVKGHQSLSKCAHSQLVRLNDETDGVAKQHLTACISEPQHSVPQDFGGRHWSVFLGNKKLVKEIDAPIASYIHGRKLENHISMRHGWCKSACNDIDWKSIARVSKSDSASDTLWKMKMSSGFVPVGT